MLKLVELAVSAFKLELANSFLLVELLEKLETVAAPVTTTFRLSPIVWLFTFDEDWIPTKQPVSLLVSVSLLINWAFLASETKFNEWTRSTERISVVAGGDIDEVENDDKDEELFVGDEEVEAIDELLGNGKLPGIFLALDVE